MHRRTDPAPAVNPAPRDTVGKRAGIFGIATNLLLAGGKLAVGIAGGSLAIAADGVNNLSDAASSALTLAGFALAARPADKRHPYGHARMEYVAGLILSVLVLFVGLQTALESLGRIFRPSAAAPLTLVGAVVLAASIALKLAQGFYYRASAARISSPTLRAAGADSFSDAAVTAVVLSGMLLSRFTPVGQVLPVDGILGAAVSLAILRTGVCLIRETSDPLLGAPPSPETVISIERHLRGEPRLLGFHDLLVHGYGEGRTFASVHAEMDARLSFPDAHETIDRLERDIFRDTGVKIVIHPDPVDRTDRKSARAREEVARILSRVYPGAAMHDFRVLRHGTAPVLFFDLSLPEDGKDSAEQSAAIAALKREISAALPGHHTVITVDRAFTSTLTET